MLTKTQETPCQKESLFRAIRHGDDPSSVVDLHNLLNGHLLLNLNFPAVPAEGLDDNKESLPSQRYNRKCEVTNMAHVDVLVGSVIASFGMGRDSDKLLLTRGSSKVDESRLRRSIVGACKVGIRKIVCGRSCRPVQGDMYGELSLRLELNPYTFAS